jgi:AcrR family transcriptional regulator
VTRRITRRGQEARARILAAARAALVDEGPTALTLRGVAARAELSLGNLQFHFADLEALLTALLEAEMDAAMTAIEHARASARDPLDAALDVLLQQHRDVDLAKLYFSLWAFAVGRPAIADLLRRFYAAFVERVVAYVRGMHEGRVEGLVQRAWLFVALLEGASVLHAVADHAGNDQALRRALRQILVG